MSQKRTKLFHPSPFILHAICVIVLLGGAAISQAQQWPAQFSRPYPQAYPPASPNPQGTGQPIQRAQNIYYGNYQDNRVPGYIYPRPNYVPNNYGYNDGGITYYYVENPYGPNYYPFASPYGTPPSKGRFSSAQPNWPAPPNTTRSAPKSSPPEADPQSDDGAKPTVSFHRTPDECFWFKANYIGTYITPMRLGGGPLATTGSPLIAAPGALGQPSTTVLFGNHNVDFNLFSGARLEAGLFLDRENRFSLEMAGFLVSPNIQSFSIAADPNGNPTITRPIVDVLTKSERGFLNSLPGVLSGTLSIDNKSELSGIELNARYHSYIRERLHADALVGFRYLRLAERLRIQELLHPLVPGFLTFLGNNVDPPNSLADEDVFRTVNQFFGPQIGGRLSWEYGCFTAEGFAKLALGGSQEQTTINGSTTVITANGNQTASGGVLALPSNIGNHNRTVFGIVPELGVNLGVELTQHVRVNLGYSFLMWNHVVRPGSQYDRSVNPTQIPSAFPGPPLVGPSNPTYRFNDEFFWSHTFNIGLEIHY
jgi:hypothetical protein